MKKKKRLWAKEKLCYYRRWKSKIKRAYVLCQLYCTLVVLLCKCYRPQEECLTPFYVLYGLSRSAYLTIDPSADPSDPNSVSSHTYLFSFPQPHHVLPSWALHMLSLQPRTLSQPPISFAVYYLLLYNKLSKLSSFTQVILIISQFLWVRN